MVGGLGLLSTKTCPNIPDNPNFVCGTCLPEEKEAARAKMPPGVALASAARGQRPPAPASSSSSVQVAAPTTVVSSDDDGGDKESGEETPIAALDSVAE